jgi:hypothetical protein
MRRSSIVRLTLLPMLATASVASADPPGETPTNPLPYNVSGGYALPDGPLMAPGMTQPLGQLDCTNDPNWRLRPDCNDEVFWYDGGVVRGGFGGYFYGSPYNYRHPGPGGWGPRGGGWSHARGGWGGGGRGGFGG